MIHSILRAQTMPDMPKLSVSNYDLPKSRAAFTRANKVIPGGVNSPARAFGAVGRSAVHRKGGRR